MKLSALIANLTELQEEHGDGEVVDHDGFSVIGSISLGTKEGIRSINKSFAEAWDKSAYRPHLITLKYATRKLF